LVEMADWVGGGENPPKYFLQSFRPGRNIDPSFGEIKPYGDEFFARVCEKIAGRFSVCGLR